MKSAPEGARKKPYQSPALHVYGDLMQMTQTNPAGTGMMEMPTGKPAT
jgi:hypothetical protein